MQKFDAVVIGSGSFGASTAFHLAEAGLSVALIDKASIGSQTTAKAAGLVGQVRETELMTRLARRSTEKFENFERETGEALSYVQSGSLAIARRPEDEALIRRRVAFAQSLGLDVNLIPPAQAAELNPFFRPNGCLAVSYNKRDLYLEPRDLPLAYARASEKRGAQLMPHTTVNSILVDGGKANRVLTDKGEILADSIVDAAGAWLRSVASLANSRVPILPMMHQIMITEPLAEANPQQPITRVLDANVAMRPYKGGLMLGGYEHNPRSYDMRKLGPAFKIEDLQLDMSVLRGLADLVKEQFPIFQTAAIQEHRGGLPTMTIDGQHVLGRAPGITGLYVLGGCNVGGLSVSPVLGEELARLIVTGQTSDDLSPMSPDRFPASLTEEDLVARCTSRYASYYTYRFNNAA